MGIKKRENYNISKKDDAKGFKCPADKGSTETFQHDWMKYKWLKKK